MTQPAILDTDRLTAVAVALKPLAVRTRLMRRIREVNSWRIARDMVCATEREGASQVIQACADTQIVIIPFLGEGYPVSLREIPDPPAVIFIRSRSSPPNFGELIVGMVGTRAASVEMCHRASELALELVSAGVTVASGLALGIDGAAHRGALQGESPCPTIAVLAHGLDQIYPSSHRSLAEAILSSGGALISEYPPGVGPLKHHFLARNRIIAGLARGVIVAQAGSRSGSLVTARFAADFGRDVFVLSCDQSDERVAGGVSLIEEGAIQITSGRNVLIEYGLINKMKGAEEGRGDQMLELSLRDLAEQVGVSMSEVLRLEISGFVRRLPGNRCLIPAAVLAGLRDVTRSKSGLR